MAVTSSGRLLNTPRRKRFSEMPRKKRSTLFSHDAEVGAHDVFQLLDELWVARDLEAAQDVRLQTVGLPVPHDGAGAYLQHCAQHCAQHCVQHCAHLAGAAGRARASARPAPGPRPVPGQCPCSADPARSAARCALAATLEHAYTRTLERTARASLVNSASCASLNSKTGATRNLSLPCKPMWIVGDT